MPLVDNGAIPPNKRMTPDKQDQVRRLICVIIERDYYRGLFPLIDAVVGTTGGISPQINNEIRNVFNHLGRAYSATDIRVAKKQLYQARWHLYIAKCDCNLIHTLAIQSKIYTMLWAIGQLEGRVPNQIWDPVKRNRHRSEELKARMKPLTLNRVPYPYPVGHYLSREIGEVLDMSLELYETIRDQYRLDDFFIKARVRWNIFVRFVMRHTAGIIGGLTIAIIGAIAGAILFEMYRGPLLEFVETHATPAERSSPSSSEPSKERP